MTDAERDYLRDLAIKQLEYSQLPIMKQREELWYKHNDLLGDRPMIHVEADTFEKDILPASRCNSEAAKRIELQLNRAVLNHEMIGDDKVIPSSYGACWDQKFIPFELEVNAKHSKDSVGYQLLNPIRNLQEDMDLLKPSVFSVDKEKKLGWKAFVEEIVGDILPVKMEAGFFGIGLTCHVVRIMGMETMLYSMIDYHDEFHDMMKRLTDDYVSYLKWMEGEELLVLNNDVSGVGMGTFGFTRDLPKKDSAGSRRISSTDMWGLMDSQETVTISPDMYGEFFFPYYDEVSKHFGLLNYGCCEPMEKIWAKYISRFQNLRKVSISPWCDEEYMGEALRGTKVIYHRKPSPNYIGVGEALDEGAFSEHILKTIRCARGCKLEFSFRDIYTLGGNVGKARRAVEIVRELIEEHWQ